MNNAIGLLDYQIYNFKEYGDSRGQLVVVEGGNMSRGTIPFEIKRVFYIYGSDKNVVRGKHANRESEFVLINVHGTSKVRLTNGEEEKIVNLDSPMKGLYIPKMIWKEMYDFSEDSVLLVLASTNYDATEYIRNYEDYLDELNL